MATAGRHARILDMIALDAGEAADFLAGGSDAEADPAAGRGLAMNAPLAKAPADTVQTPEREKAKKPGREDF